MPNLKDTDPFSLGRQIKKRKPELPVILLVYGESSLAERQQGDESIDQTFLWSGDSDLLLAIVKNVEDKMNVDRDTRKAGVPGSHFSRGLPPVPVLFPSAYLSGSRQSDPGGSGREPQ